MNCAKASAASSAPTLILLAHGARDPEWAAPLQRIVTLIAGLAPQQRVATAFLGMLAPSLEDCVAACVADGDHELLLVPVFIATGGHLKRELPERVAALRERFPQASFRIAGAVGEADSVLQAIAAHALAQCAEPAA